MEEEEEVPAPIMPCRRKQEVVLAEEGRDGETSAVESSVQRENGRFQLLFLSG